MQPRETQEPLLLQHKAEKAWHQHHQGETRKDERLRVGARFHTPEDDSRNQDKEESKVYTEETISRDLNERTVHGEGCDDS